SPNGSMTTRTSSTTTAPAISQADPIHSQRSPPSTRGGRELLTGERGRALGTSDRAIGTFETPVGPITVSSDGRSVVGLEWRSSLADAAGGEPDRDHSAGARDLDRGQATDGRMDPILVEAIAQLRAYFDGRLGDFDLPVAFGPISDVAKAVLTTLSETVEAGTTVTYGELPKPAAPEFRAVPSAGSWASTRFRSSFPATESSQVTASAATPVACPGMSSKPSADCSSGRMRCRSRSSDARPNRLMRSLSTASD